MRVWSNPPVKKRKTRGRRRARRGPNGRFLKRKRKARRAHAAARRPRRHRVTRHRRKSSGGAKMARRRRKSRSSKRSRAARKAARTRKRNKAHRRAIALKNFRKGRRRKGGHRRASHRRRRKPLYRTRGRRRHATVYKRKGRWYASPGSKIKGRRINPRRRRRHNPGLVGRLGGFFPTSLGQFKDAAIVGAGGAVGYLGVSALNNLMDRFGVASLKAKVTSPVLGTVVNALQSIVSTFLLAGVARMVIKNKPQFTNGIFAGGAAKAVLDVVTPFLAQKAAEGSEAAATALSGYQEQLMGYQYGGVSGFQTSGMGYVSQGFNRIAQANYEGDPATGA